MTSDEKRAYSNGYNAGLGRRWPAHKPPTPPNERVATLLAAVAALRDEVAAQCATFDPGDPMVLALLAKSEAIDAELTKWTEWLHSHESTCDQGKTTP